MFSWHEEKKVYFPLKIVFSLSTSYIWCNWECCLRLVHLLCVYSKPPHRLLFSQRPYFILLYSMHKMVLRVFVQLGFFFFFWLFVSWEMPNAHTSESQKRLWFTQKAPVCQSLCSSHYTAVKSWRKEVKVNSTVVQCWFLKPLFFFWKTCLFWFFVPMLSPCSPLYMAVGVKIVI